MNKIRICSTGMYVPGEAITNEELKAFTNLDIDCAKLENKLGIKQRHIAKLRDLKESTADFATKAALDAINNAGISVDDIGLIIVGTDTPEFISPPTALIVQGRLKSSEQPNASFDISASCASFSVALDTASRILASDQTMKYALVIGVYNMTAFIQNDDAFGNSIFADGAGAFLLEKTKGSAQTSEYVDGHFLSDGTQWDFLGIYKGAANSPITHEDLNKGTHGLQNLKPLPSDRNVKLWPKMIGRLLEKTSLQLKDVDHIIFTQINRSVIHQVMEILDLPLNKTTCIMDKYGYTGSSCLPIAFHHAVQSGAIKRNDRVVFVASGAGLTVGCNMLVY